MPRPLSLKVVLAASVLLLVVAGSSHAHGGDHDDDVCLVCVASADFAPDGFGPVQAFGLTPARGESEGRTAARFPVRHADYSARAPPSA